MKLSLVLVVVAVTLGCTTTPESKRNSGGGGGVSATGGVSGTGGAGNAGAGGGTAGTNVAGTNVVGGTAGDGATAGIGGTAGTSGPSSTDITADVACQRIAEQQCEAEAHCCESATDKSSSKDACIAQQKAGCVSAGLEAIGLNPRTAYDVPSANAAFADFELKASTCDLAIVDWATSELGFAGILKGTVPAGGKCTPKSTTDSSAVFACMNDYACMPATTITTWNCEPRAGANGRCYSDISCQDGLRCDPDQSLPSLGECLARKAEGESCVRGAQCASLFCEGTGSDCKKSASACKCVAATQDRVYCLHAP